MKIVLKTEEMEEMELQKLETLLSFFCGAQTLSRKEEVFIIGRLGVPIGPKNKKAIAYGLVVDAIRKRMPHTQNDNDNLHEGRIYDLHHRSNNPSDGLKVWNKFILFDYLYQYIGLSEKRMGITTRADYILQEPDIILDKYTPEEVALVFKRVNQAAILTITRRLRPEEDVVALMSTDEIAQEFRRLLQLKKDHPNLQSQPLPEDAPRQEPALQPESITEQELKPEPALQLESITDLEPPVTSSGSVLISYNEQALRHRLRQLGLLAVVFGLSTILLAALYFSERKSHQAQGMPHINYAAFKGDSIGQFQLRFRLKDTLDGLWEYPTLTFYRLKDDPENNDWFIVEMEGLFRSNDGGSGPNTTRHIGIARKYGSFIQFELEPIDAKEMNDYGKWYATIYHAGGSFPDVLPGKKLVLFGTGGGISNYDPKEKPTMKYISNYTLRIHNQADTTRTDRQILKEMLETIEIKSTAIDTLPESEKYQLLRTMFKGG
jgi:hypothetical protein